MTGDQGISLGTLGNRIRIQFGDFKVRDYGYSQFKQYIQSFPRVELIEDGRAYPRCLCGRLKVERIRYRRGAD